GDDGDGPARHRRPHVHVAAHPRHGGFREPRRAGCGDRGQRHRDGHRRTAPDRRPRPHGPGRGPRARGRRAAAEHGGLLHRARRGPHRQARPRGVRDRPRQARGHRRRADAPARRARAAARRRGARRRRLHRPALHDRRPGARAAPRGRRMRGGHAARLADRQRHGHREPVQPAAHRRAGERAGDPRRRRGHGVRRDARARARRRRGPHRHRHLARGGARRDGAGDPPRRRGRPAGPRGGPHPAAPVRRGVDAARGKAGVL
ncbi:MAG: Thiazole synthase, partial [uncultured Solirubrobacteraceae bacterium]